VVCRDVPTSYSNIYVPFTVSAGFGPTINEANDVRTVLYCTVVHLCPKPPEENPTHI
jgi:hypothetical protein